MIRVEEATDIVLAQSRSFGTELTDFRNSPGRILAQDIVADRDMPAFDRATMDGIAIRYSALEEGKKEFKIRGIQAAGEQPIDIDSTDECIEIMTGAAVAASADTIVRYEDIEIESGSARLLTDNIRCGQNIHRKGTDRKEGDILVSAGTMIDPSIISAAAFTGHSQLLVRKQPRIVVIANGDELQDVSDTPPPYKIRRSNIYTLEAALRELGLTPDLLHLRDDEAEISSKLQDCIEAYDVVLISGGVSMGKFDHVHASLERLGIEKLFHKVQQRPGKPFWFGKATSGTLVFAFPGNPVSTFMCFYRYFMPWYRKGMGLPEKEIRAVLASDISFKPALQYFLQVALSVNEEAQLVATPAEGNGSGDLANLLEANAFMELPLEQDHFTKGSIFRVWPFKQVFV